MQHKFLLKIEAESPDGEAIRQQMQIKVACERSMAVSILANLFNNDDNFKLLAVEALALSMSKEKFSERISDEEYANREKNGKKDDLDF